MNLEQTLSEIWQSGYRWEIFQNDERHISILLFQRGESGMPVFADIAETLVGVAQKALEWVKYAQAR